jgi:hypothetical protein
LKRLIFNWLPHSVTNQVKGQTEDVIMCCLVRAIAHAGGGERWVWSNGGMIIIAGENRIACQKKLFRRHFVHHESHKTLSGVQNNINTNSGTFTIILFAILHFPISCPSNSSTNNVTNQLTN